MFFGLKMNNVQLDRYTGWKHPVYTTFSPNRLLSQLI